MQRVFSIWKNESKNGNTYYTGKLINVGILIQLRDVSGTLIASFLAFAVSYLMPNIVNGYVFQLILGLLAGLLTFIIFVFLCRFKELDYIKQLIENDNIDNNNNHAYNQSNSVKEGVFYIEQEELEHNNKRNAEIKVERKRRKNINTETTNEEHKQQVGLFDERKMPQKKDKFRFNRKE